MAFICALISIMPPCGVSPTLNSRHVMPAPVDVFLPAEERRVELLRPIGVVRGELGPGQRAGLGHDLRADVFARLPHLEHGARRILQHRHASGVHHVERRRQHGAAQLLGALRGIVGIGDRDVGVPVRDIAAVLRAACCMPRRPLCRASGTSNTFRSARSAGRGQPSRRAHGRTKRRPSDRWWPARASKWFPVRATNIRPCGAPPLETNSIASAAI